MRLITHSDHEHQLRRVREIDPDIEAAFRIPDAKQLWLNAGNWWEQASSYLARQITHEPSDLRSHVQRIYLHLRLNDEAGIAGALLDLYIALGDKGQPLRTRMLIVVADILESTWTEFFIHHQDSGVLSSDITPPVRTSMLTLGLTGTPEVICCNKGQQSSPETGSPPCLKIVSAARNQG
ncbi:MAG: hypothetical protein JMN24_01930 [gamma proteobacterium endosymbiont of Lamellibrachia anaximandri]|nr:hypothetical protein [gamma proteobacterium endosymbiont of Lamellibrachia anaximandri]MBL3616352.1 hypothetical protein [gamma proteobacterium endosymbiont of Lamellibrachia anaximandri]